MKTVKYCAYVQGQNGALNSVKLPDGKTLVAAPVGTARALLRDAESGQVHTFDSKLEAHEAAMGARWSNQTFGVIPASRTRAAEWL